MVGIFCPSLLVEIGLTDLPKSGTPRDDTLVVVLHLTWLQIARFTTYVLHTGTSEGLIIQGGSWTLVVLGGGHNLPPWLRQSKQNFDPLTILMGRE